MRITRCAAAAVPVRVGRPAPHDGRNKVPRLLAEHRKNRNPLCPGHQLATGRCGQKAAEYRNVHQVVIQRREWAMALVPAGGLALDSALL
jgi:hypothetical protein